MTIRVALLGCGYWGPNFARNLFKLRDCEAVAVADLLPARLDHIRRLYPGLETTTDTNALLKRPDVDAIVIATPTGTHFELARNALVSGKHVLVTKPITQTVAQAEKLLELAERNRRILMVDHTFIYSGPVRTIRELIRKKELGDFYYYDSTRVNLGLFQHDVNVLWDLGPHDLSIMLHLLDEQPIFIAAVGAKPSFLNGHTSVAYMTAQFESGMLAHFHLSWLSPVKIRRTLLAGTKKMVVYDHLDPDNQVKVYDKGVKITTSGEKENLLIQYRAGDMYAPKVDQTEAIEIECQHFLDCIREAKKPITDGEAGLRVVRLLEAAELSMTHGGKQIDLRRSTTESTPETLVLMSGQ